MILKLQDRTEIYLSQEESQVIVKALDEGIEFIKIGDTVIRRSSIASLLPGGLTQADVSNKLRIETPLGIPATPDSPGYKKFLATKEKLSEKLSATIQQETN